MSTSPGDWGEAAAEDEGKSRKRLDTEIYQWPEYIYNMNCWFVALFALCHRISYRRNAFSQSALPLSRLHILPHPEAQR